MTRRDLNLVDLQGLPRDILLLIAERACVRLGNTANYTTTDEGDKEETEQEFGLEASEIVEMAHDNIIVQTRGTLDSIIAEIAAARAASKET